MNKCVQVTLEGFYYRKEGSPAEPGKNLKLKGSVDKVDGLYVYAGSTWIIAKIPGSGILNVNCECGEPEVTGWYWLGGLVNVRGKIKGPGWSPGWYPREDAD